MIYECYIDSIEQQYMSIIVIVYSSYSVPLNINISSTIAVSFTINSTIVVPLTYSGCSPKRLRLSLGMELPFVPKSRFGTSTRRAEGCRLGAPPWWKRKDALLSGTAPAPSSPPPPVKRAFRLLLRLFFFLTVS